MNIFGQLFKFPDPVEMVEAAINGKLEREVANSFVSSTYSGWLSFVWTLGKKPLFGLGPALQAMAIAQLQSLRILEAKGFLTLTVPTEMLESLSKFQTEQKIK